MRQGLRLRTQFVLAFSSAVLLTLLLFAVTVTGVLVLEDWVEHPHPAADFALREGLASELWPVLGAMALSLPVALVVAVGLGRALAVRALAPMVEAARRARAARASPLDLSLPMRGTADEWDELAATLNTLLGDARGALERVHRFTADAAHELRTPLTVLRGEAEVALRRERTPAEYQRALRAVHEEALRLGSLVEALLALARADAGSLQLHLQPLGLRALAQEAVGRAQATVGTAPGRLQVQLAEGDGLTRGDKALLGQVLDNLLANALRHARTQVRVEAGASPDTVWVEVRDDGAGVPREFLPRLFERFARADGARTRTGTGLGLSIARSLVQAHGGRLTYVPAPGGGSIFRMELPAPQDDAPVAGARQGTRPGPAPA